MQHSRRIEFAYAAAGVIAPGQMANPASLHTQKTTRAQQREKDSQAAEAFNSLVTDAATILRNSGIKLAELPGEPAPPPDSKP